MAKIRRKAGHVRCAWVGATRTSKINVKNQRQNDIGTTAAHARCAWAGAAQTPKVNVKKGKMTLGITSAQHVHLYETVDSSKFSFKYRP